MYTVQVGQCRTLHVLSMRENELTELPDNLGQLEELTVLDVVGNRSGIACPVYLCHYYCQSVYVYACTCAVTFVFQLAVSVHINMHNGRSMSILCVLYVHVHAG